MKAISILRMLAILWAGITLSACTDWMYDDRSGCEHGVCLSFKYDYNLQRADMIGHVGSVGVFVYDEEGRFVTSYIEPNLRRTQPCLYLDLPQGNYQFLAVAQQRSFDELQAGPGANFTWSAPDAGDGIDDFSVSLAHQDLGNGFATVPHGNLPLDTLWHAVSATPLYVPAEGYAYDTLSLVRDTKSISVSLREIDRPETMDVADYDFFIYHRDLTMAYSPATHDLEASAQARTAIYTPYATWNTSDTDASAARSDAGRTAHADFMTSRLYADGTEEDRARLVIRHRDTDHTVIEADLCNLLGQLRNYDETQRYSLQEFLDRGYDFRLTFFLQGGEWQYAEVSIGILGWSKRIQNVSLD